MNELKSAAKPRTASGRIQGRAALGNESEVKARDDSPMQHALSRQHDQMEKLFLSLQELENRLSPVLMPAIPSGVKREGDVSCGCSPIVALIEQTTNRLEEYADKVDTIISVLEI